MKIAIFLGLMVSLVPRLCNAQVFTNPLNMVELDQQVSADGVSNLQFVTPSLALASLTVKNGATPGFIILVDSAAGVGGAQPACTGPSTARPCVMWCVPMAANTYIDKQWNSPLSFRAGIYAVYSSTGCGTITGSTTAMIMGQAP